MVFGSWGLVLGAIRRPCIPLGRTYTKGTLRVCTALDALDVSLRESMKAGQSDGGPNICSCRFIHFCQYCTVRKARWISDVPVDVAH